jgi:ATP-dependent 26S proteasome regulatory subunit
MIRALRAAFARAAAQAPRLLFIDEIDSFGDRNRKADHNSAYTDFIVTGLIDLLDGYDGHEGVGRLYSPVCRAQRGDGIS